MDGSSRSGASRNADLREAAKDQPKRRPQRRSNGERGHAELREHGGRKIRGNLIERRHQHSGERITKPIKTAPPINVASRTARCSRCLGDHHGDNHRGNGNGDHREEQLGAMDDGAVDADSRRVGRIFDGRNQIDGQEGSDRKKERGGPRVPWTDSRP